MTLDLNRRSALLAAAGLPLAAVAGLPGPAHAAAEQKGAKFPSFYRFPLGDFEVTTLAAASRVSDNPQGTFGMNASAEDFTALSKANAIPADRWRNSFSPVLVNTGAALLLFDTGLDAASIVAALSAAGHAPEDVDMVVLTHMHGDHIGGLMNSGAPTFTKARYVAGKTEYDHWDAQKNEGFLKNVKPLPEITFIADGDEVVPGITAISTPGHTPGHLAFRLTSGDKSMIIAGDVTNHYVWSLSRPNWEVRFDADKPLAAETRNKLLTMIAEEAIPFTGYHMPFPAVGYVVSEADGFRYLPATYQLTLDAEA